VIGQAIFRVIGLAILLASWFWIVRLAVDVANGMSGYILSDQAVGSALRRTFAGSSLIHMGFPLLGLLTGIMLAFAMLALVVLKFIIPIAFAALYIGGPALIGFAALPRVGNLPLAIATRGLLTLTIIPLLWTVVFAAWAGVSAGMFDTATGQGGLISALMGPGMFLAGLVVMLGVTKKVLAMATFGVPLATPGATIARSAVARSVSRGLSSAVAGAAATGSRGGESPTSPRVGGRSPAERTTGHTPQPAPSPQQRRYRTLDTSPDAERVERDRARRQHRASTSNSAPGVDRDGAFVPPRHAPRADVEQVTRGIGDRRPRGDATVEEVRHAGDMLTSSDRAAFAAAAEAAQQEGPDRAQRHFERTASVQIAGAPALDRSERDAAITIASAHPDVVRQAFAPDYQSFGRESDSPTSGYDPRLMDQHGGLEQFRQEFEGKQAGSRERPPDDEGLPF
jgi:hypothetical protein